MAQGIKLRLNATKNLSINYVVFSGRDSRIVSMMTMHTSILVAIYHENSLMIVW